MKTLIASIALLLCLTMPSPAPAQGTDIPATEAQVVLIAPSEARVGELVRFDASDSVADSFEWLVVPQSCPDFEVYDAGRKAVFSARMEGDYQFIIACAKDGTVDVMSHVLHVEGPPPMPTNDRLDEWIPFWFWAENLPKAEALALADSFEAIAARADELKQPKDWIIATADANREVLGDRIDAWGPLLDKIGAALRARAENGALNTPEEHAAAWLEVAAGLRKA